MPANSRGAYSAADDIVDYILGITFEIWEQRQVELIDQYYASDCVVYGLDGITRGSHAMIDATHATLDSFPDRNLLAEAVIWSGDHERGYYSSHCLESRATNLGPTVFGQATGANIRMTNIADCVVEDGKIVREWLIRDNMVLAQQLGADPTMAAGDMTRRRSDEHSEWLATEWDRVWTASQDPVAVATTDDPESFATATISAIWQGGAVGREMAYAPYAVLHRSPLCHYSGRESILRYYDSMRDFIGDAHCSVDHVAAQPFSSNGVDIAVRWTVAGIHSGEHYGIRASRRPVFVLGVTHWQCVAGRIVRETTVFDDLAVLSQIVES